MNIQDEWDFFILDEKQVDVANLVNLDRESNKRTARKKLKGLKFNRMVMTGEMILRKEESDAKFKATYVKRARRLFLKEHKKQLNDLTKSQKSTQPLTWNSCVAHEISIDGLKYALRGNDLLFQACSSDIDFRKGVYFAKWEVEDIVELNFGMIKRSLEIFNNPESNNDELLEELIWFCSQHFDDVCKSVGFDSNNLRIALPNVLVKYHQDLCKESQGIINDFRRLKDAIYLKSGSCFESNINCGDITNINEIKNSEDFDYIDACIDDVNRSGDVKCEIKPMLNKDRYKPLGLFDFIEPIMVKHKIKHRYFGKSSYRNGFQTVLHKASLKTTEENHVNCKI